MKMQCSQLDEIHLGKVWRTATEDRPALAIQRLVLVTDPDVLGEALCPVDLVVTDSQIVAGDPDDRPFRSECLVLEGALYQLIALVWCEILQLVSNSSKECVAECPGRRALSLGIMRQLLS